MLMTEARIPVPNPQVLFTEIDDGTGVLLHLDTKFYFTLNATGVVVWKALAEPVGNVEAIAERLAAQFCVTPDVARQDVAAILESLLADRLVANAAR
jgi:Coenzyme PQQ synthesis protein D (PqqD)